MPKRLILGATALFVGFSLAAIFYFSADSQPLPKHVTVPDGFTIELVAGPPLVERPITADFDEEGRLYVAESSGSNEPVEVQLEKRPHEILRLTDIDGDGFFDERTVFADRMMFPEGTLWFDGSLYVSAPPSIWKLTDTDGDGIADVREEWFNGKTLTHCANDLHGPYLGRDGWIYWCKGAFGEQTYERPGRSSLVTRAAHIFRRHPEGTLVESVLTGGMDNPVDVDFTPEGERILTATFFEHPQLGRRDALIHAIYGGVYGKDHDVLEGHERTGDLLPNITHYGPAAPAGLTHYPASTFGEEYKDNFFATLFNLNKVTRHVLKPAGATFETEDSDFVVSDDPDFHPTDVLPDADGSLLVVDTGGWYKLCCPTSQLEKPDVLGGIYRVRRTGEERPEDPRGLTLPWESPQPPQLVELLDDPRPAVRDRAIQGLAEQAPESITFLVQTLHNSQSPQARLGAVWSLTRIDDPSARAAVHVALQDEEAGVRQAATHSVAVRRDATALPLLESLLQDPELQVRRATAEALGRIGDSQAVPWLLAASDEMEDRILEHSLIYALIEINDPEVTAEGLHSSSLAIRKAALIALDQMEQRSLQPSTVVSLLTCGEPELEETAWWVAANHSDWGGSMADFFRRRLRESIDPQERRKLETRLAHLSGDREIQSLLAEFSLQANDEETRLSALNAMAESGLNELPATWTESLHSLLSSDNPEILSGAVSVIRSKPPTEGDLQSITESLQTVAQNPLLPAEIRLSALEASPQGLENVGDDTFQFLVASLNPDETTSDRYKAATVLEEAQLSKDQLMTLVESVKTAGPLELSRLIVAFDQSSDESLGLSLVEALADARAVSSLRPDLLMPRLEHYPPSVQEKGQELLASLDRDPTEQKRHLDELLVSLGEGDVRRGQAVFNGEQASCSTCHAIGYLGGKLGPDLTRIGQIRSRRDLLEAIVYPSASFVRSYEPVIVTTEEGEVYSGVLQGDSTEEIILGTGANQEVRISRAEVVEMRPGTVSVMPAGLDEQLSHQELADLLAFLEAARR